MSRNRPLGRSRHRAARLIAGLALSAALAVALPACTPPNLPAPLPPLQTGSAPPSAPVVGGVISIGVDADIGGFNPYVVAQYSPAGRAISALVLPSVFAPGATDPGDQPTALVDEVAVTALDPFTVTYTLNRGAAWSDGTPIAAEDFTYLWQQMIGNSGLVSPGGYDLIAGITSLNAGKTVVIRFSTPYADWRTLFSPLLPARTLRNEPGGFTAALEGGIPVAGGAYRMDSFDAVIGQITLVRNDKYWVGQTDQTRANTVVFRAGSATELLDSFERGDLQALYMQPTGVTAGRLANAPGIARLIEVPLPVSDQLEFNLAVGHVTAQDPVRTAIAAALTTADLRSALADGNASGVRAPVSQVSLAADPAAVGGTAAAAATDNRNGVGAALSQAGYSRDGLYFRRDGQALTATLGYLIGDARATATAALIQRQLGQAGIGLNLVALNASDLLAPPVAASVPDLVLSTVPRGPSDSGQAVAALACGSVFAVVSQSSSSSSSSTSRPTTGTDGGAQSATCPTAVQLPLARWLLGTGLELTVQSAPELVTTGSTTAPSTATPAATSTSASTLRVTTSPPSADQVAAAQTVDSALWSRLAALPIAEPVAVLALGPSLAQVSVPDAGRSLLWGGPLRTLPSWIAPQ